MEKESFHFLPLAAQAKAKLPERSLGSKPVVELLLLWIFQTGYCRKGCCDNLMEKPFRQEWPDRTDLGLACCV